VPEHLIPVIPSPETLYSLRLWKTIQGQVKFPPMGGKPYALDLGSVATVFQQLGIDNMGHQLTKMQSIFNVIYVESAEKEKDN